MSIMQMLLASGVSRYLMDKSLRFRASASAYLNRVPASASNRTTYTWSGWVKRGLLGGSNYEIFSAGTSSPGYDAIRLGADSLQFYTQGGSAGGANLISTAVFRDPSSWYHIVVAVDSTQATASNRVKMYVNGTQITALSTAQYMNQNNTSVINSAVAHNIGCVNVGGLLNFFDGYLADVNFIDGQALTPASFGETNALTGVWQPKAYTGTYGTNGFYLDFETTTSVAALGTDKSGNGNTWTVNNISLTAGVTYDSMTDVPTLTSDTAANYAVLNPVSKTSTVTLSNGNLTFTGSNAAAGSILLQSGTAYFEALFTGSIGTTGCGIGIVSGRKTLPLASGYPGAVADLWYVYNGGAATATFNSETTGTNTTSGAIPVSGNTLQIAIDATEGKIWYGQNNTWYDSAGGTTGSPSTGANPTFTISSPSTRGGFTLFLYTFASGATFQANFGQRPFAYTPPTGFKALNTFNLLDSAIVAGNKYFDATAYTGTGSIQSITNSGSMQPDLLWIKGRSRTSFHDIVDSVRGVNLALSSNSTAAEVTGSFITSLNSNGFTLPANTTSDAFYTNVSGDTMVAWQWKGGGTAVTNTAGSITSQVSANTTSGFSVVTYTGTGANATVGHGLGVAPKMIIVKQRNGTFTWRVYHSSIGNGNVLYLSATDASTAEATAWNSTTPASTVFSIGTSNGTNGSTNTYVAYCFAEIDGFSKFGSYTGNGSADGPFIYCGFKPKLVLRKGTSIAGIPWSIVDGARNPYNLVNANLFPNTNGTESVPSGEIDILANGFKFRSSSLSIAGETYIYAAFAESPFKNSLAR